MKLVVYGHYGKGNVGDELMKLALQRLFLPHGIVPTFVDHLDAADMVGVDGVIFGGGSILFNDPQVSDDALATMLTGQVPVFYVGVGGETGPSPVHQRLIDVARVVAFRELDVPDLAYVLADDVLPTVGRDLLFIPNVEVVPTHIDPHWMHIAWERFKDEVAQALDVLIDRKHRLSFLLMCSNDRQDDMWPMMELIGRMRRRPPRSLVYTVAGLATIPLVGRHRVVITQRYHGTILSEMAGTPYVSIDHHDKLRYALPSRGTHLPYHGIRKDTLLDAVDAALVTRLEPHRPALGAYDDVISKIVAEVQHG